LKIFPKAASSDFKGKILHAPDYIDLTERVLRLYIYLKLKVPITDLLIAVLMS
jgi:hypothetical protein